MTARALLLVCVAVALSTHTACSRPFITRPVGSLDKGITFQFFDQPSDSKPFKVRLYTFAVQRHIGPDQWSTVWELWGKGRIDSVVYGQAVAGFQETTPAAPLDKGGQYRAIGFGSFSFGAGYAAVQFAFNGDGTVRVTEAVLR
jgi:hypothetical protein